MSCQATREFVQNVLGNPFRFYQSDVEVSEHTIAAAQEVVGYYAHYYPATDLATDYIRGHRLNYAAVCRSIGARVDSNLAPFVNDCIDYLEDHATPGMLGALYSELN